MKHEKYIFEMCPDSADVIKSAKRFEGFKGEKNEQDFYRAYFVFMSFYF